MACVAFEPATDAPDTCIAVTLPNHDPHDFEVRLPQNWNKTITICARVCKRCHQVYWSPKAWELRTVSAPRVESAPIKAQDGTTDGDSVDEPLSLPMAQAVSLTDMLDAAPVAEISQNTARRLLATIRAWYPRIMCEADGCDEESWSPFRHCEKHEVDKRSARGTVDSDPEKMGGSPCVTGTRIPIRCVLDWLGTGYTSHQVVKQYPSITALQIKDALDWVSEAIEGFPDQPPPKPTVGQLEAFIGAHWTARSDDPVLAWLRHQAEAE